MIGKEFRDKKKNKKVAILVPVYNEESVIRKCLKSLTSLNYPKEFLKIIVVDDGSTDNTFNVISKFAEKHSYIRIVRSKVNSGKKSVALNKGLKKLDRSDVVVVLDADSVVSPDTLNRILPFFDKGYDAVSMRYMPWNRKSILAKLQVFEYMYSILWRKLLSIMDSMYVTPGVFSAYSHKALKEVGSFNEKSYSEDMEIAIRLQKAGYRIAYSFSTTAYTMVPTKLKPYIRQRERWYRGYFDSFKIHKDVLFNRKLGNFGALIMPLNVFSVVLVIFISVLFVTSILKMAYNGLVWLYKLYLINFDVTVFVEEFLKLSPQNFLPDLFRTAFLNLDLLSFITLSSLILAVIMLFIVKKTTREAQGKDLLLLPLFLVFYLPLNSYLWLYSLALELLRFERKW
jgi:cellulose synthase/poly-beta-1,6-N-acetylglucosamine synthase-like glycosyltransferase